ncbi:hypothetical protein LCGC14_2125490 [marine sediment metagenome]|uniref:Recombination endonuclease VII n=1 Tax=marine sediment metagenome TaxID=412755 RepID=A0A0F9GZ96_9ZZZZ
MTVDRRQYQRRYYKTNRQRICERNRRWGRNNRDRVNECKRRGRLRRQYGITVEQRDQLLMRQKGRCSLCHVRFGQLHKLKPVIDHNHKTGKIRGLIHRQCNTWLVKIEDTKFLALALSYLQHENDL